MKINPVKVSGSGRVIPGTIINISTEVQGVLNSSINLKKELLFQEEIFYLKLEILMLN